MTIIQAQPLTRQAFAPFGDVIEKDGARHFPINKGKCVRYHDLAQVQLAGGNPRPLINIFGAEPYPLPVKIDLVERHPLGSQAFIPFSNQPFLVIVAPDTPNGPDTPLAFLTKPGQGVNYHRNVWHGVLRPMTDYAEFLVVDRGGDGCNLEEYTYAEPWAVELPKTLQNP